MQVGHRAAPGATQRVVVTRKGGCVGRRGFVGCYNPKNHHERKPADRFRSFTYEELTKRDKLNLDIFWLKDESLEDRLFEMLKI
jgi:hypothetical protein